ncbi:PREDICTED: glucan endo-1,3-beta-glucosidase 8-like [Lupinus angustifolius]|uniref:glucan endo-1,3-beta-glucosidase 8-like n=1 Tax=Lupinus angustifolius TaxID=3871 RepID=UPI00092E4372|nr:PREDICTED: glucan endo-1,3-beta-glucosidase 8-like [Lupinus angustifolius]
MARTEFLMWILVITLCQLQDAQTQTISSIGVNWGAQASQPMEPSVVVKMLKENGIKKVKLFDADSWTVSAFKGTDIELMVGIPNDQLKKLSKSKDDAEDWVKDNVTKHLKNGDVNIRYVSVGNEAFLKSYNGSYIHITFPAMQRIQSAIEKAGHGDQIKVTTALNADVYESSSEKPSDGDFRKDIYTVMKQIVQFLDEKNSPFVVNIYPFLSLYQSPDFPKEFAFFDSTNSQIDDDGAHYSNMFDANLDTLVASLKKIGHPNVSIVIGEIGWPTDGDINANIQNAKKFYRGFFKKMATKKGSPRHPKAVTVYLFGLFDENLKSVAPGNFERHWGIFRYDGKAKFQVDFSGKGEDKYPISAKGVRYQENKWCVLKKDVKNITSLGGAMSYACAGGDCTSLGYGCTCNGILDGAGNASYAFNQYFQINEQSVEACDFDGVADIVSKDPSKGNCLFPVAIYSSGNMLKVMHKVGGFFIIFSSIFTLFM